MKIKSSNALQRLAISLIFVIIITLATNLVPGTYVHAASIGVTDNGSTIVVTSGAGLIYTINKTNGDMTSCKLNGTELNGTNKASQISSGLGSATVTWTTFSSGATVLITCATSTLTQYYASKYGSNIIYMGTYITEEPSVGELRYIFRGNMDVLTSVPKNSNLSGNSGTIESTDVYGFSTGYTASKYYGNDQTKDLNIKGATGSNVGVFMAYGSHETGSGGPFQRDIQFQRAYPDNMNTEITNYLNSTHAKTEDFRTGLFGPYALVFTTGSTPSVPDFSWMSSLGLKGYVASSSRGQVVLNGLSGMDTNYTYTIGFANTTAQYWATTSSSGVATCPNMKVGTYTMQVYKGEIAVYTENVTVTAGSTTTLNTRTITGDPSTNSTIWRIGDWDGTPLEFLSGKTFQLRHPSDVRNSSWGPVTYAVGSSTNKFPAAQFRGANSPTTVTFTLTSTQASAAHTLKLGITTAYNNGRPSVTINGHALTDPVASTQPRERTLTVGTYRGNNANFTWSIPSSDFVTGSNTITITPISGSSDTSTYLSASFAYDCVELEN
ncbi:rhamnogalacturonan lyase B N-terminal domain-containing protein [Clostridium estertheticum]|uniref:Rhamnogalacturonan endolyase n=1 Tax=Clostridium estertheticum TaxID=238834 RepID=A0AA47ELI1_9CLOT|nr:rhamnogalacturonan lyase B N-terminal domain-containing protein [Clostridium estertheticum]MBU3158129.1 hypothetical protein [Clostridium estertheticum]WAG62429.1 hypothetical protein LL038_09390 [Clostridium estertheticum]